MIWIADDFGAAAPTGRRPARRRPARPGSARRRRRRSGRRRPAGRRRGASPPCPALAHAAARRRRRPAGRRRPRAVHRAPRHGAAAGPARRRIHASHRLRVHHLPARAHHLPLRAQSEGGVSGGGGRHGRWAVARSGVRSGAAAHVLRGVHALALVHKHHIRVAGAHPAPHHLLLVLRMHAVLLHPCARERPQRRAGSASAQILGASAERVRCGRRLRGQRIAAARAWVAHAARALALRRRRGCRRRLLARRSAAAARRRLAAGCARRCRGRRVVRCSALRSSVELVDRFRGRRWWQGDVLATSSRRWRPPRAAAAAAVSRTATAPAPARRRRPPLGSPAGGVRGNSVARDLSQRYVRLAKRAAGERVPHAAPASAMRRRRRRRPPRAPLPPGGAAPARAAGRLAPASPSSAP